MAVEPHDKDWNPYLKFDIYLLVGVDPAETKLPVAYDREKFDFNT
jgi:hypothetical protein